MMRYTAIAAIICMVIGDATSVEAGERPVGGEASAFTRVSQALHEIDDIWQANDAMVCLALTLYWESRNQSWLAQKAVGHVVVNRARAPTYPADICEVVTQGNGRSCQFSWYCDGLPDQPTNRVAWWRAVLLAIEILDDPDDDPTDGALYFHRKELRPAWARAKTGPARVIGDHVFFRLARG